MLKGLKDGLYAAACLLVIIQALQHVCLPVSLSVCGMFSASGATSLHDCLATCDMPHADAGCQAAQSKVGSAGLLDPLVALLTPPNQVSLLPQQKQMPPFGPIFLAFGCSQLFGVCKSGLQALSLYALLPDMCAVSLCSHAHLAFCCDMQLEC